MSAAATGGYFRAPRPVEAVPRTDAPRAETEPQMLRVRTVDVGCRALLRVSGPLNVVTAPALGEAVQPFQRRGQWLIVDLRGVEYIETPALRLLIGLCAELRALEGQLCLVVEPGSRVERTLRLVDMEQQCGLFGSVREAWSRREAQLMPPVDELAGGAA